MARSRGTPPEGVPIGVFVLLDDRDVVFGNGSSAVASLFKELTVVFRHVSRLRPRELTAVPDRSIVVSTADAFRYGSGCPPNTPLAVFLFTPPAFPYSSVVNVEAKTRACGSMILWHRPAVDSRQQAPRWAVADVEPKDAQEIATELGMLEPRAVLSHILQLPAGENVSGTSRWWARTRYDPDFFGWDPSVIRVNMAGKIVQASGAVGAFDSAKVSGKALGDRRLPSFTYVTEGGPVTLQRQAMDTTLPCDTLLVAGDRRRPANVFVHYPWVRDNVYHTHNDNILPLLVGVSVVAQRHGLRPDQVLRQSVLVVLPSSRSQQPLPVFDLVLGRLFSRVVHLNKSSCVEFSRPDGQARPWWFWGRPPRLFSAEASKVLPYVTSGAVALLRTSLVSSGVIDASLSETLWKHTSRIRVVWLARSAKRRLENSNVLLNRLRANRSLSVQECCDGRTYREQASLVAGSDVLVGVHGAGLLHILHIGTARSSQAPSAAPLVVHIGSRRLNYHEQVVIERLALALGPGTVRFHTTRAATDVSAPGAWQESFSLPEEDLVAIASAVFNAF